MNMQAVKRAVFTTVSAGALLAILGAVPAAAVPTFTINPNAIPGISGYSPKIASDLTVVSNSIVKQTSASTQTETGYALANGFINNGIPLSFAQTGQLIEDNSGSTAFPDTYNLYFTYTANVSGITGFGPGQVGNIDSFNFTLRADVANNDTFTLGDATTGAAPTISDTNGNDIVLAVGNSLSGSAGFQTATGAPIFSTVNNFVLCNGTANQGFLGGTLITGGLATGCGTFNAASYFTAPSPFYSIAFVSTTAGSASNVTVGAGGALINGIVADVNFSVPEPLTLSLFGAGLAGIAVMRRRKKVA